MGKKKLDLRGEGTFPEGGKRGKGEKTSGTPREKLRPTCCGCVGTREQREGEGAGVT